MSSPEAQAFLDEVRSYMSAVAKCDSFPPWMSFSQAERFLGLKFDPKHRSLKRFLCEENIPVKRFNGNRKRVSRARLEKVMEENIEYVAI
jgi:hypothetical protein